MRIAGSNGYERPSSKHSEPRDAEYSASNLYEKSFTFISVMADLSMPKFAKAFVARKKACAKENTPPKKRSWGNTDHRVEMYALEFIFKHWVV